MTFGINPFHKIYKNFYIFTIRSLLHIPPPFVLLIRPSSVFCPGSALFGGTSWNTDTKSSQSEGKSAPNCPFTGLVLNPRSSSNFIRWTPLLLLAYNAPPFTILGNGHPWLESKYPACTKQLMESVLNYSLFLFQIFNTHRITSPPKAPKVKRWMTRRCKKLTASPRPNNPATYLILLSTLSCVSTSLLGNENSFIFIVSWSCILQIRCISATGRCFLQQVEG